MKRQLATYARLAGMLACMLLFVTSCKTSKTVGSSQGLDKLSAANYLEAVIKNSPDFEALTSRVKFNLNLNGKNVSVNGILRMKHNDVIQLSLLMPVLRTELGRLEITRDYILIIDRMNRRYVQVPYGDLKFFADTDVSFYTLQSLFWNKIFLPGKESISVDDFPAFSVRRESDYTEIEVKKSKLFAYLFMTKTDAGQLTESTIGLRSNGLRTKDYHLNWKYRDFQAVENKNFPTHMNISFKGGKKPMEAELILSRMSVNSDWDARTAIPGKYKQMDVDQLLKQLLSL